MLSKGGKFRNESGLILIIFLIASVTALQGTSSSYTTNTKLDFGTADRATSTSYVNEFIAGFEAIGDYLSSSYTGRFGAVDASLNASSAPTVSGILINSTDGSNRTAQDLHCFASLVDADGGTLNATVRWYNNSVLTLTQNYNGDYASGGLFIGNLDPSYTSKGQNWSCGIRAYDGVFYSSWSYSGSLTILNTPPVVNLSTPLDGSLTTNITPTFTWNATDDDGDSLTYDFNISLVASSLCTDLDQYAPDLSDTSYTVSPLSCYFDNGDYYTWSVRAKDDEVTGNFATYFSINLSSYVAISLPTSSVSFGSVAYLGSNDTTDDSPSPFVIQNDGNALINVNISATDLWDTVSNPTDYYKLKIDNVTGEEGAFNWTGSYTVFRNVSITNNTIFISKLNSSDATDSAEVDVYIEVPINEPPTAKSSTVYFTSSFAG